MKRARKWSADNRAGEGHAAEPGGPLRRRRALRQLDSLALDPDREPSPAAATAHVRVIGEPGVLRVVARTGTDSVPRESGSAPGEPGVEGHPAGSRVHAVPIDQPFGAPSRSVVPEN
ncbi:MAG: hypothetical protein ABSH29_14720 [Acidimicrobiales bacterium]|jgi:hypothetical protein